MSVQWIDIESERAKNTLWAYAGVRTIATLLAAGEAVGRREVVLSWKRLMDSSSARDGDELLRVLESGVVVQYRLTKGSGGGGLWTFERRDDSLHLVLSSLMMMAIKQQERADWVISKLVGAS